MFGKNGDGLIDVVLNTLDMERLKERFGHNIAKCEVDSCDKRSLGVQCARCAGHFCFDHAVIRFVIPPSPYCVECIKDTPNRIRDVRAHTRVDQGDR